MRAACELRSCCAMGVLLAVLLTGVVRSHVARPNMCWLQELCTACRLWVTLQGSKATFLRFPRLWAKDSRGRARTSTWTAPCPFLRAGAVYQGDEDICQRPLAVMERLRDQSVQVDKALRCQRLWSSGRAWSSGSDPSSWVCEIASTSSSSVAIDIGVLGL